MTNKRIIEIIGLFIIFVSIFQDILSFKPAIAKKLSKSKKFVACRLPAIKNGRIKIRNGGRKIKFKCFKPSILVGASTSSCVDGNWIPNQLPVCAKVGCGFIEGTKNDNHDIQNGYAEKIASGAFVKFHCHPGYHMQGIENIYCDGFHWSGDAPTCFSLRKEPNLVIDFDDCLKMTYLR